VVFKKNDSFTLTRSKIIKLPLSETSVPEQLPSDRAETVSGKIIWAIKNQTEALYNTT
jgi:hypothetical protein